MSISVDLKVAQLLCSRLCHDLAGPAGAVNAGLELVDEDAAVDTEAAMDLVARSAQQVTRRLAFYRVAFGLGGTANASVDEVRGLALDFVSGGNVALDWPAADVATAWDGRIAENALKLLLNLVVLGCTALPRGGTLSVRLAEIDEGVGVAMAADGPNAGLKEEMRRTMQEGISPEDLTAYTVQGYFSACLAQASGSAIEISDGDGGGIRLAAILPVAENQGDAGGNSLISH